jgi:outer membrane protein assembly factor BamB
MAAAKFLPGILLLLLSHDSLYYYNSGDWPVLHCDSHNSDHLPKTLGDYSPLTGMTELKWVLRELEHPSALLTAVSLANISNQETMLAVTGKVNTPNLHAFDMDGNDIWHTAASTAALNPGPDSCAMASSALVDEGGNIYISDCHHIFCYSPNAATNSNGDRIYTWKVSMPNLRQYHADDQLWHTVSDPALPDTMAKPFVSMFFTRPDADKVYLGGITIDGGVYIFNPDNGSLYASSHLIQPAPGEAADWNSEGSCDPQTITNEDNPMYYSIAPDAADGIIPNGIWCTGATPETNDPDRDYFMNPCQIQSYLSNNTASNGAMVVNTPAVTKDPANRQVSRILVNGSESEALDTVALRDDAMVYRVDFDPTASSGQRLTIRNYQQDQYGTPLFVGRMPAGENSGSSPDITPNGKFLATGDNNGQFYLFSVDSGQIIWSENSGALLGSATLPQTAEADGSYTIYTWGDSKLWAFNINPDTGVRNSTQSVDMRAYVVNNFWRTDNPGYAAPFIRDGKNYEKTAVGASIIVASNDYLILSFSVGWHHPDDPDSYLIPTHNVLLFINREHLRAAGATPDPGAIIDAHYLDTNGTLEQAAIFTTTDSGKRRGFLVYGSQSTSLAQFLDRNDKIPEAMKDLYIKPYGGVRVVEPVFPPQ